MRSQVATLVTITSKAIPTICRPCHRVAATSAARQICDTSKHRKQDPGNPSSENNESRIQTHGCESSEMKENMSQSSMLVSDHTRPFPVFQSCLKHEILEYCKSNISCKGKLPLQEILPLQNNIYHGKHPGHHIDCTRFLSTSSHMADKGSDIVLDMMTGQGVPTYTEIVPGKGRPPVPPTDCCAAGCIDCVWIDYVKNVRDYYSGERGEAMAKQVVDAMQDPQLKLFLKIELGLK